jgi:hypothetical protein
VISDGTQGPVVEIIKRSAGDQASDEAEASEETDE